MERVAYLLDPASPFYAGAAETYQARAGKLGLRAAMVNASKAEELESAFREMVAFRAQGLVVMGDIDKIFRGGKPQDIPIVGPTTYDFVINRATADLLKIKIPPTVLLQATSVVE